MFHPKEKIIRKHEQVQWANIFESPRHIPPGICIAAAGQRVCMPSHEKKKTTTYHRGWVSSAAGESPSSRRSKHQMGDDNYGWQIFPLTFYVSNQGSTRHAYNVLDQKGAMKTGTAYVPPVKHYNAWLKTILKTSLVQSIVQWLVVRCESDVYVFAIFFIR